MARKGFNIFEKIAEEISDFDTKGVYIVGKPKGTYEEKQEKGGERGGYYFSMRQTLMAIDMAVASKFKKGIWDEEGQRKTFLNIVNFYRDVMKMKININVADYIFTPLSSAWTWVVWLIDREFKVWASMKDYDDQIDELADDLATYGTCVSKKVDRCPERVPLRTIRITQTAKSAYQAANSGGYFIIENDLHYNEMQAYKDWDLDGLDKDCSHIVMERYGLVPENLIADYEDMSSDEIARYVPDEDEELVLAIAIVIEGEGESDRKVLFMEKLTEDDFPIEECHIGKRDGRWLGYGEVERQLENQLRKNMNSHIRMRGLLWAARKYFTTTDEDVPDNLMMEVPDGGVIKLRANGQLNVLNTQGQHGSDMQLDDKILDENSKQNAFAFEVATGESMPSNTPFRLGVILEASVAQHFKLVKQTFSRYLKRAFFDQILPEFKEDSYDEHELSIPLSEEDLEAFREELITYHVNIRVWDAVVGRKQPDSGMIRQQVEEELARNAYAFIKAPDGFYEDAELYMKLNLTDDISADLEDLKTLWSDLNAKGDERAEGVLRQIFALRGKALPAIMGKKPAPAPVESPMAPAMPAAAAPAPVA